MEQKITKRRLEANRANAQKSSGPKSEIGKAKVRWNALKHGLLAKSIILPLDAFREERKEFDYLLIRLHRALRPIGMLEEMQVEKIAVAYWRLRRVVRAETGEIGKGVNHSNTKNISKFDLDESLKGAFAGLIPIKEKLSKHIQGVQYILTTLKRAISEVQESGSYAEPTSKELMQIYGIEAGDFSIKLSKLNHFIKNGQAYRDQAQRDNKDLPDQETCKNALIGAIAEEINKNEELLESLTVNEQMASVASRFSLELPSQEFLARALRYEIAIENELNKAIEQLERLQKKRIDIFEMPTLNYIQEIGE